MGLHEDAMELRKKICDVAPEAYKKELSGKPWEVAVLASRAYWENELKVSSREAKPALPLDADMVVALYMEGRSLLFISYYCQCDADHVYQILKSEKIPVVFSLYSSISFLHKKFSDKEIRSYFWNVAGLTACTKNLPAIPATLRSKPNDKEIQAIKDMFPEFSIQEIAVHANRPVEIVTFIVIGHKPVETATAPRAREDDTLGDSIAKKIVDMYKGNRSPEYISTYLDIPLKQVETCLIEAHMPYYRGYSLQNISCFLSIGVFGAEFKFPFVYEPEHSRIVEAVKASGYQVKPDPITAPADENELRCIAQILNRSKFSYPTIAAMKCITGRTLESTEEAIERAKRLISRMDVE